jgi:hypothetical protein
MSSKLALSHPKMRFLSHPKALKASRKPIKLRGLARAWHQFRTPARLFSSDPPTSTRRGYNQTL